MLTVVSMGFSTGCAILHKAQIGEIDNRSEFVGVPFEIKVSETGVDLAEAAKIQKGLFAESGREANALGDAAAIISLFQMGPRTGAPVFSDKYAEKLVYALHQQCPTGRITGLNSIREMRKYPVISGEIVKITGLCLRQKETKP